MTFTAIEFRLFDRLGNLRRPGCKADQHRLGWIPGRRYCIALADMSNPATIDTVLGYRLDGSVDVFRSGNWQDGQIVNHRTAIHYSDQVEVI